MVDYESMTRPELIATIRALEEKLSQAELWRETAGPDRDFALLEQERVLSFERTLAEGRLQQQKKLLDAIIENLPVGLTIKDAHSLQYLLRNRVSNALTGHCDEYIGKTCYDLFPRAQAEELRESDLRALATKAMVEIPEQKSCTKSGEVGIFHVRKIPIFDESGQPQLVVSIYDDVTRQKLTEKALQESEAKYRNLVETSRDLIWSADADGCITFINQAVKQIYGYEPEEMLGRRLAEFFGPLHTGKGSAFFREMLTRDRTIPDYECQALRKDGTPVFLSSNAVVLRDESGTMIGVTGVSKDVTLQKEVEHELRESEERFRLLAENIRDVFWIMTSTGNRMLYVSPAYEQVWGMSRKEVYHNPSAWMDSIHAEDLPLVRVTFDKIIRGEATAIEYRLVRPDGSVRWIWNRSYAITTNDGMRLPCGIAEDITDRKRMEAERLAREVAQRETLVKEVHHRIKNHLQGIAGLLRQKTKGHPALAPLVESAVAELQSVAVAFGLRANLESGNAELKSMLEAIIASVQGVTGGRVSLAYGIDEREQVFVADSEKVPLALVLNELSFNALKHGSERGRKKNARISVRKQSGSCRITVTNKGKLTPGFDFARGRGIGSGLDLVRSLLPPKDATLVISGDGERVTAVLTLKHPVIAAGEPASPHHHHEAPHVFAAMR